MNFLLYKLFTRFARVVELVDTQDLKSCAHCERAGSSHAPGTSRVKGFGHSTLRKQNP